MLKLKDSGQFKKDYKKCAKRGLDMGLLKAVVNTLAIPDELPDKNKDHRGTGKEFYMKSKDDLIGFLKAYIEDQGGLRFSDCLGGGVADYDFPILPLKKQDF